MTNLIFVRLRENGASTAPVAARIARLLCVCVCVGGGGGSFVRSSKSVFVQFTTIYPSPAIAVFNYFHCYYVFGEPLRGIFFNTHRTSRLCYLIRHIVKDNSYLTSHFTFHILSIALGGLEVSYFIASDKSCSRFVSRTRSFQR